MSDCSLLKSRLDSLYENRSSVHLENDPLSFCHRYPNHEDQEIVALIAALLAYGSVKVIKGSLKRIFDVMGESPSAFVDNFIPGEHGKLFNGFKHRFNNANDICALLWAIRQIREQEGSIENFFCRFHNSDAQTVEQALNNFCPSVLSLDYRPVFGNSELSSQKSYRFLFPMPSNGSACKRLCMFLRWVVRPSDGIDLGLWRLLSPKSLIIPVDRHIERIGQMLGLTKRSTPDWQMASEITSALRELDQNDPVKYDFSICHLGISEGCNGIEGEQCKNCPVTDICKPLQ